MAAVVDLKGALKRIRALERLGSAAKAPLQELAVARSRWTYSRRARREGLVIATGDALRAALRARLARRRSERPPPSKGELHVFLAYGLTNWEAVLPRAFAPFGRVTVFEWRRQGFDDRGADWLARRDDMNRAMLDAFDAAQQRAPVDAVVAYVSGYNASPETLLSMATRGAAIFNFCWDDKINFPGPQLGGRYCSAAGVAQAVDLTLTNAPSSIVKYAVHGGLALFSPEAAHPDVHHPHDVPFDIDVSFVGARYGWRPAFIERLSRLGVHVECFGPGWPNGALRDEDMVALYSRSRINLGMGGVAHARRVTCIKGRDFEVPLSGGLYLTQHNPELALVYDLGHEIVTYRDEEDCARKIRWLLSSPLEAEHIRAAGRTRCLRDHTYERRWSRVFEAAGLLAP